jgi:hypothetical protein
LPNGGDALPPLIAHSGRGPALRVWVARSDSWGIGTCFALPYAMQPNSGILERVTRMDKAEAIALLKGNFADFCSAIEAALQQTPRAEIIPADDSPEEDSPPQNAIRP